MGFFVLGLLRRPPTAAELFWLEGSDVLDDLSRKARKFPPLSPMHHPPAREKTHPPPANNSATVSYTQGRGLRTIPL